LRAGNESHPLLKTKGLALPPELLEHAFSDTSSGGQFD
jgi:hypothetical protein